MTPDGKCALDRYVMGLWRDRELELYVKESPDAPAELAALLKQPSFERPQAARKLREAQLGADRPTEPEMLEALIREAAEVSARGLTVLPQLQHDLGARVPSVPAGDARAKAAMLLIKLGAASQVQVAMKSMANEALAAPDRVSRQREETLKELRDVLAGCPHLLPVKR